MDYLRKDP